MIHGHSRTIWRAWRTKMNLGVFEDFEGFFWLWSRMTFFEEILIWVRSFLICNKRFKKEIFQPVLWHAVSSSHKIRPSSWPIKSYLTYRGCQTRKLSVSSLIQVRDKKGWKNKQTSNMKLSAKMDLQVQRNFKELGSSRKTFVWNGPLRPLLPDNDFYPWIWGKSFQARVR